LNLDLPAFQAGILANSITKHLGRVPLRSQRSWNHFIQVVCKILNKDK
jgi:hypothetical protein